MFQEKYKSTKDSINMGWLQFKRNKKLLQKLRRVERIHPLKLRMHVKEFSFIKNGIHGGKKIFYSKDGNNNILFY